ncbi:uncharacterized protein LOC127879859 [Dreissena polymorpha]|nr:uncharacterized protein LOC127879859 [Dreissena polymorpha]KAH3839204.1 hypothetical protein DPMN_112629 [Dreissena polymorpha]
MKVIIIIASVCGFLFLILAVAIVVLIVRVYRKRQLCSSSSFSDSISEKDMEWKDYGLAFAPYMGYSDWREHAVGFGFDHAQPGSWAGIPRVRNLDAGLAEQRSIGPWSVVTWDTDRRSERKT